jgi:4-amino-4-deoxy-L-arabinose transferase-like glycosyltransferase
MPATKSSKSSRRSKNDGGFLALAVAVLFSVSIVACAVFYFYKAGATLYYGDAEAHLDIARRIVDSRTPGWSQVGTTWLPLPHLAMLPFVRNDWLWQTGLAGAIPAAAAIAIAAIFLFLALRRFLGSAAAFTGAAVFLLNPNVLYLGSVPMTEPFFMAGLLALLYLTARFAETRGWGAAIGAGIAGFATALTRYEAWFLLPFAALYLLLRGGSRRWAAAACFCAIAGVAPLLWLAHNRWYFGDPLYFYRGPWSALAIQGAQTYPGKGDWRTATRYFLEAAQLVAGWPAIVAGGAGAIALIARRALWPLFFLVLPAVFYVWSIHSSATPIYVPTLWPFSFYNVRYGAAIVPLTALGAAAIVALFGRGQGIAAAVVIVGVFVPFAIHPNERSIVWREAETNSRARRQWIAYAAEELRHSAGPNQTYFTSFGDLSAIYRTLGISLRFTLTGDNEVQWDGAVARPDLFLHTDWAVAMGGDTVQTVVDRARLHGPKYELQHRIIVKGAPAIEIYRRIDENPVH